jgi:NAD(P)-dependent dehydrogenase (short-subunit alcohol dehydrogenase family)
MMTQGSVVMITGASRGIGRALVTAFLEAGARRVYAAARELRALDSLVAEHGARVVPVQLDVTNAAQVEAAARQAADVSILVNNAGRLSSFGLLSTARSDLQQELETNFYAPLAVTRALLPSLEQSGGAVVNLLSVVSLASMAGLGGYSASKAAAFSLTQALRAELRARGVSVHGVFPGPVDTDMAKDITLPKTSPADVARAIVAGVQRGDEDILPDPMSQQVYAAWATDPKAVERQFGAM